MKAFLGIDPGMSILFINFAKKRNEENCNNMSILPKGI